MREVLEAIDELRRLGVHDVQVCGDKVRMLNYPRNPQRAKALLREIKPFVMQHGGGSLRDLRRVIERSPAAPVNTQEETAQPVLAHLPDPPYPAPDIAGAPKEWLELVDWGYVRQLARNRPAGWQNAVGVHLAIRRLYPWYHAIIEAATEGRDDH